MDMYQYEKVMTFVDEEDVKFIRLAFFDAFGVQKNISILSGQLERAFKEGISFDASAVAGFDNEVKSDLFLHPDPSTFSILPWRPSTGRVARMYCDIRYPDGTIYEKDSRYILKMAVEKAKEKGLKIDFGTEVEFYLFNTDEQGNATKIPFDMAGYMDVAPEDKGENIRREICFTLIDMGIEPEASHHEEGPGQNEIDFMYSDPLTAADNTATFKWVVSTAAMGNGLCADFSPKPIKEYAGNGMHINMSVRSEDGSDCNGQFMTGILEHIRDITLFLNPSEDSYRRLGEKIDSKVMMAVFTDSMGDVITTSATILSLIFFAVTGINIDGIVGVGVALVVMWAGVGIARDTLEPLIGQAIDPEVYEEIKHFVEKYDGIEGTHDLIVHNYGPGRSMASIHAEVPNDVDIEQSHEIIDRIEREAAKELGIFLVIHMDPVEMRNKKILRIKETAVRILHDLDPLCSLHDFRVVHGEHQINLIFDMVVPIDYDEKKKEDLSLRMAERMKGADSRYECVITVESDYVAQGGSDEK